MKKPMRGLSLALCLVLVLTLALPALAAGEAAEGPLTRGDFVKALFGLSGVEDMEPKQAYYEDVPMSGDLALAVRWAVGAGIVNGYGNGRFGPDDPITREQLAVMVYRYAQSLGKGFRGAWMFLLNYPDAGEISPWADEAMHYAVMNDILIGSAEGIFPKGTVSAEELSPILDRVKAALGDGAADLVLRSGGLILTIPGDLAELVEAEAPEAEDGTLFTVSEKASLEAAEALGEDWDGAGWLFAIRKVSQDELNELLCYDMSGVSPFAKDGDGNIYLFCTPTDVRILREGQIGEEDMEQWSLLNAWAGLVPQVFLEENAGLEPFAAGNSDLEICLNRILQGLETRYTLSTLEFLALEPGSTDPAPYIRQLLAGTYEYAEGEEVPDGEYVVLSFPEDSTRYDFFYAPDGQNLIRKVVTIDGEDYDVLFMVTFDEGGATANGIMDAWYHALAKAQGLTGGDETLTADGLSLTIPADTAELVKAETPEDAEDGTLFTVSEKASIEAAEAQGEDWDGAGWLFAIRKVSRAELDELLCYDMSGVTPFAKDGDGNYYLFCTPTDVRVVRTNGYTQETLADWAALCGWAAGIPKAFIAENGLEPFTAGNSELEIYLNRILSGKETYTVSTLKYMALEPENVDPAPYVKQLLAGTFSYAEGEEVPDGEYAVLAFPEDSTRFDFFFAPGGQNLIRKVVTIGDTSYEILYRAEFADGGTTASGIVSDWYDAIARDRWVND